MSRRVASVALWLVLASGIVAAVAAALVDLSADNAPSTQGGGGRDSPGEAPAVLSADSLTRVLMASDPFRVARRAAAVPFDPDRSAQGEAGLLVPRPALVLRGIVLGDTARALIEGVPGTGTGRLVRVGEVIAGLRVQSVSAASVRVTGFDTTWVLTLKRGNP